MYHHFMIMEKWFRRIALLLAVVFLVVAAEGCARNRPPRGSKGFRKTMEVTAYCDCKKCCNWKRNIFGRAVVASGPSKGKPKKVGITASGTRAKKGTIAADTRKYPFGTVMYIQGYGYGRVEDRGRAIKGEHIDLFFPSHKEALRWGKQRKPVGIWLPRRR